MNEKLFDLIIQLAFKIPHFVVFRYRIYSRRRTLLDLQGFELAASSF